MNVFGWDPAAVVIIYACLAALALVLIIRWARS